MKLLKNGLVQLTAIIMVFALLFAHDQHVNSAGGEILEGFHNGWIRGNVLVMLGSAYGLFWMRYNVSKGKHEYSDNYKKFKIFCIFFLSTLIASCFLYVVIWWM